MRAQELTARRFAVWSGIAVAVLFGVGSAIWGLDMPEDGTPVVEVLEFYRETADQIVVGGSLSLLAIACFVLFAAAVRQVLIEAGGEEFLATTAFGGAVLAMAAGIGAETINLVAALRARDAELNEPLAQSLFEISQILRVDRHRRGPGCVRGGHGGGLVAHRSRSPGSARRRRRGHRRVAADPSLARQLGGGRSDGSVIPAHRTRAYRGRASRVDAGRTVTPAYDQDPHGLSLAHQAVPPGRVAQLDPSRSAGRAWRRP